MMGRVKLELDAADAGRVVDVILEVARARFEWLDQSGRLVGLDDPERRKALDDGIALSLVGIQMSAAIMHASEPAEVPEPGGLDLCLARISPRPGRVLKCDLPSGHAGTHSSTDQVKWQS